MQADDMKDMESRLDVIDARLARSTPFTSNPKAVQAMYDSVQKQIDKRNSLLEAIGFTEEEKQELVWWEIERRLGRLLH